MEIKKSPSEQLVAALQQYAEELEAIRDSLTYSLTICCGLAKHEEGLLRQFAKDQCTNHVEGEDGRLTFTVPAAKLTDYQRLKYRTKSINAAQRLMPRNTLVAMVCSYDAFLGKLLRYIFEAKPDILDTSDRKLAFSELKTFDSIDDAREHIVENEVENILRQSHVKHFKWLETRLGCTFTDGLESWPDFVELTERRNLFVHTDGIISSQYLAVCRENGCQVAPELKVGVKLVVSQVYLQNAFSCLYEIGIKLAHVVWRKLVKSELKQSDDNVIAMTFRLVEHRYYSVAIRVLKFFADRKHSHGDETLRRVKLINLAQAYKWEGLPDKCSEVINGEDWSSQEEKFKLAVAVLKDDWEGAFAKMRKLSHDPDFRREWFREWPLFKELRKNEQFPKVYRDCYGENFSPEEAISPLTPAKDMEEGLWTIITGSS